MSNYIPWFLADLIVYPCHRLNVDLTNLCQQKRLRDIYLNDFAHHSSELYRIKLHGINKPANATAIRWVVSLYASTVWKKTTR